MLTSTTEAAVGAPPALGDVAAAGPVAGSGSSGARPATVVTAAPAAGPVVGAPAALPGAVVAAGDVAAADRLDAASPIGAPAVGPVAPAAASGAPLVGAARPGSLPNPLTLQTAPSGVKLFLLIIAVSGLGAAVTLAVSRRHQRAMDAVNLDLLLGLARRPIPRSDVVDRPR